MKQRLFLITFSLFLIAMIGITSLMKNASPTIKTIYAQEDALNLVSVPVDEAPTLDGVADEAFWADVQAVEVEVKRGENESNTTVSIKSVYVEDKVYFLVTWADPTESFIRSPWELQEDGTWAQLKDPDDKGGDNNVWYEDKLAFIWPIANSIPEFEEEGCGITCHAGENEDVKPYGNKYTEAEGQIGDIWHWKSVRNLNQVDDQYVDHVQYSADTPEAGRHSDPSESGGYKNNLTEDKTGPAFMPSGEFPVDGAPGYILEDEAIPFDASVFQPGDRLPAIIKSEIVGDRGDLAAGWKWEEGVWTLEFGRNLVTESEGFDVQFDDLSATYYFGVAVFDNAQVRHAYHRSAIFFTFQQ